MNHYDGSGDDQSEDGQLRSGDENSNEDEEIDTADSLEIKPPQAHRTEIRHRSKKSSKDKKHSRDRRHRDQHRSFNDAPPAPQHHQQINRSRGGNGGDGYDGYDRNIRRHKHRQDRGNGGRRYQNHNDGYGRGPPGNMSNIKTDRDGRYDQYRDRDHIRITGHIQEQRDFRDIREPRDRDKDRNRERQHQYPQQQLQQQQQRREKDSPDKSDGDKMLEDLRSRLLIKKRKYETEAKSDEKMISTDYDSKRLEKKSKLNQDIKREKDYDNEREKEKKHRHKEKRDRERKHTVSEITEDDDEPPPPVKIHKERNPPKPLTMEEKEQASRKEKLLEAEREMARRKELARDELEARREIRRLESVRDSSSESPEVHKKKKKSKRSHKKKSKKHQKDDEELDSDKTDDDEEQDTESDSSSSSESDQNDETKDESDVDMTSPLSVGELTKSDVKSRSHKSHSKSRSRSQSRDTKSHSRSTSRSLSRTPRSRSHSRSRSLSRSRSHSRSRSRTPRSRSRSRSRSTPRSRSRSRSHTRSPRHRSKSGTPDELLDNKDKSIDKNKKDDKAEDEPIKIDDELPPYYPGIQGCRSVEEFQCLNRIEEGTYGVVYRAKDKRTETIVALKKLKMEKEKEGFPITSLREINTLLKGQHPNIVTVREIVVGSNMDKIFIVMDYVEHDLKSLMETMKKKKQVFLPGEVKCLTQQLLKAVAHLHDNWILHRDLKTSNLLLSHKGILKVGDFGLAREYGSPLKAYTSIVVTLWYRAPELLLCSKEYSTPIDIWSVGCIFAEFLAMTALFPGKSEVDQLNRIFKDLGTPNERIWPGYSELPAVQRMTFTEYPVSNLRRKFSHLTSELGMTLLQGLLTYDPKQRLTADQALKAHYFTELPVPIDPAMFPTWPAKSELGSWKQTASPKPPSGGSEFKQLGADDNDHRYGAAMMESRQMAMGPGFSLKF